jgi:hypothetical protein
LYLGNRITRHTAVKYYFIIIILTL